MNKAFPDATVEKYEWLIPSFQLPDEDDRHVLAAAVRCSADVIVTSNLKDFPKKYLTEFDLEVKHPDLFIANLIDLNSEKALSAFKRQVSFLKNPPKREWEVLETLKKSGLATTNAKLLELIKEQ